MNYVYYPDTAYIRRRGANLGLDPLTGGAGLIGFLAVGALAFLLLREARSTTGRLIR